MDLSTASAAAPTDGSGPTWSVTVCQNKPYMLTIALTAAVVGPIIFTLPGIQINDQAGTVPITITEYPPPARRSRTAPPTAC